MATFFDHLLLYATDTSSRRRLPTVHLEYISDLIEPAFVEIDLKRGKVRLIFTRCEDAANRYDFNSKFNNHVKTL